MNLPDYNFISAPLWLVTILHVVTLTVHFVVEGYTAELTLDGETGAELLGKAGAVVKALQAVGATPAQRNSNGRSDALPQEKVCRIHQVKMRLRSGRGGDNWYSHRAFRADGTEFWCRGEEGNGGRQ